VCDPARTADSGFEIDVLLTGSSDGFTMIQDGNVANISGTPALVGTCNVTCTVKDSNGNSVNATAATIEVSETVPE
jgi:hypothetical protein